MYPFLTRAETIEELERKISDREIAIQRLEKEIEKQQEKLTEIGKEKSSLEKAVSELNSSRQKVLSDINLTENRIESSNLNIEKLAIEIDDRQLKIENNLNALAQTIRSINESDYDSFIEQIMSYKSFSDIWNNIESLEKFQTKMKEDIVFLKDIKKQLNLNKQEVEERKEDLSRFKRDLEAQKQIVDATKREKDTLLTQTKNTEANYQKILEDQLAAKEAFEREMRELEEELKIAIDPDSLPQSRPGVLAWPLDSIYITQYFGNTEFATQNPQVYGGSGHNGIDLRASRGTQIRAALSGTVRGIGNTDEVRGCYSYGKWVLVEHKNGLSTLYAPLSVISVNTGQEVNTGQVIGYSGNTGYSTGPHLHFTVYATQGVQIQQFSRSVNCKNAHIPIAGLNAYLNPLSFLPKL